MSGSGAFDSKRLKKSHRQNAGASVVSILEICLDHAALVTVKILVKSPKECRKLLQIDVLPYLLCGSNRHLALLLGPGKFLAL
jgi:hypothetical protein